MPFTTAKLAMGAILLASMTNWGCAARDSRVTQLAPVPEGKKAPLPRGNPRLAVPLAAQTIAKLRPAFRQCFARMQASGKVSLQLTIGPEGQVVAARASGPVPRKVSQCIEDCVKKAHFGATGAEEFARLDVPVAVYRQ